MFWRLGVTVYTHSSTLLYARKVAACGNIFIRGGYIINYVPLAVFVFAQRHFQREGFIVLRGNDLNRRRKCWVGFLVKRKLSPLLLRLLQQFEQVFLPKAYISCIFSVYFVLSLIRTEFSPVKSGWLRLYRFSGKACIGMQGLMCLFHIAMYLIKPCFYTLALFGSFNYPGIRKSSSGSIA